MSKEKLIKKGEHMCSVCGRISAAKSVLKEAKDEKTGIISYRCTNSKKCAQDKKAGLVNGQREKKEKKKKKIIVEKKATETKKVKEAQATA